MQKQFYMQKLVYLFYEESAKALKDGANINDIVAMKVREDIGRYKYTLEENIDERYKEVHDALIREISGLIGKEED
jgi:V/A-type H+-transporting ATPase subunit A